MSWVQTVSRCSVRDTGLQRKALVVTDSPGLSPGGSPGLQKLAPMTPPRLREGASARISSDREPTRNLLLVLI